MGMLSRMSTIVKSKINRVLDDAEDPRETLDYSYEKQREMLRNVKRGVVRDGDGQAAAGVAGQEGRGEHRQARQPGAPGARGRARGLGPARAGAQAGHHQRAPGSERADRRTRDGAGQADARRAAAPVEGRVLPHAERGHQGPVQRRAGPGPHRLGAWAGSPRRWAT